MPRYGGHDGPSVRRPKTMFQGIRYESCAESARRAFERRREEARCDQPLAVGPGGATGGDGRWGRLDPGPILAHRRARGRRRRRGRIGGNPTAMRPVAGGMRRAGMLCGPGRGRAIAEGQRRGVERRQVGGAVGGGPRRRQARGKRHDQHRPAPPSLSHRRHRLNSAAAQIAVEELIVLSVSRARRKIKQNAPGFLVAR